MLSGYRFRTLLVLIVGGIFGFIAAVSQLHSPRGAHLFSAADAQESITPAGRDAPPPVAALTLAPNPKQATQVSVKQNAPASKKATGKKAETSQHPLKSLNDVLK